jgi:C4-dicarboxylate-specific signal transduction histidine kinase
MMERVLTVKERIEKERLSAITKMAGAVCHEMSQPMQALNGYIGLLKMDPQKYATADHLKGIEKQTERIAELLAKLHNIRHYKTKAYLKEEIVDIDASAESETTTGGNSHE